jgi:N-acetylglucosamine malate deacetylase 1
MIHNKRILVLAPHTDDGEFGCGASISKLIEQGNTVVYMAFSACQQSVLPQFPQDILITEVKQATNTLGIFEKNLILLNYEVRTFNYRRQEILDDILRVKKDVNPEIVFMPSLGDIHQDHFTITNEGIRAFKFSSILCYELPWNNFSFNTSCFITVSKSQLDKKCEALSQYKSQAHRPYASKEFISSLAKVRGVQSGGEYAESFELIRWLI